jgi:hypothetical protein
MKPTVEQLEAVTQAVFDAVHGEGPWSAAKAQAEAAWNIIAPLVRAATLEEAARELEDYGDVDGPVIASAIRALRDRP